MKEQIELTDRTLVSLMAAVLLASEGHVFTEKAVKRAVASARELLAVVKSGE